MIYQNGKTMATMNITLSTGKAGKLSVFTIEFSVLNFDAVIEAVSGVKTVSELKSSNLWRVI